MLTDFAPLRYGSGSQFATFSKGCRQTVILHETSEIPCFRGDDFLTAGLAGSRICEEGSKALEFGLLWRKTLTCQSHLFRNES